MGMFDHKKKKQAPDLRDVLEARAIEGQAKIVERSPTYDPTYGSNVDDVQNVKVVNQLSIAFPSSQPVTFPVGSAIELLDSAGVNKASISAAGAVKTDSSATTQPISAVSLPLPTGAALDATLTNGNQKTQVTNFPASQAVTLPAGQAVELLDSAGVNKASISAAGAVKVDGSAVTQPISAVALPLPAGAALDATLTGGTAKERITGNAGAILDAAVGAAVAPANGVAVLAQFNTTPPAPTNAQTMAVQADAKGNILISGEGRKATYRVANSNANSVAGLCVLMRGSATKIVKITRIHITVSAATAALVSIFLAKGTGGATGGTVSNNLLVSNVCNSDSTDGVTTVNALAEYSAAFTNTTPAGFPASQVVLAPSATVAGNGLIEWMFGSMGAKPLTLRGINELIGIQFNAVVNYNFEMEWTEE